MPPIPEERLEDFKKLEWCNDLLADPSIEKIQKRKLLGLPESGEQMERTRSVSNTLFTTTLFNDEAVRAFLSMYRRDWREGRAGTNADICSTSSSTTTSSMASVSPSSASASASSPPPAEALLLVSLGANLDGATQRLHGGATSTLLDHVMGTLMSFYFEHTCATAELSVKYKKAVRTPCVLLCRARFVGIKGRWVETVGWIEDGRGMVYAEGRGAFVLDRKEGEGKL
ncbi:hypothetical protein K458DRAFT_352693 [Lentithecium fluviatile CBS 122367]|uniref:Thioesterase domain-containing protein n=1 Tax=Lentithecium fluviatile CBS 122367 TaxID=1168545 RepID=A0A6G1ICT6_9PLEO|nr:hypothetical protein K458DRAFT_352693 [Lentithecium fluviatile CBS 122367]